MSIYLAWSVYKLIGVLLGWILVIICLWKLSSYQTNPKNTEITTRRKIIKYISAFWLVLIFIAAFNIGDRQQELGRSSFNASQPQEVSRVNTNAPNVESVNKTFESVVKKSQ